MSVFKSINEQLELIESIEGRLFELNRWRSRFVRYEVEIEELYQRGASLAEEIRGLTNDEEYNRAIVGQQLFNREYDELRTRIQRGGSTEE